MKQYEYIIGIDTGVKTGVAVWSVKLKKFITLESTAIHLALWLVLKMRKKNILVRVEDARLRKWVPKTAGRERLQGVGSVKRDAKIWQDFLEELDIDYELVAPKNNKTKVDALYFEKLTGERRTNEHSRDAGMLCYNYSGNKYANTL